MIRLAQLGIRRPRAMLCAWVAVIGALTFVGLGIDQELHRSDLSLKGSGSDAAKTLEAEQFGEGFTLSVLLTGTGAAVSDQGRAVVERLEQNDDLVVLSPWTKGADPALRPNPEEDAAADPGQPTVRGGLHGIAPALRAQVDEVVSPPVAASFTGFPALANAIHGGTVRALQQAEMIAAPILAIVLMFVFRSLVSAAVPLVMGFATIAAGAGVLTAVNRFVELDLLPREPDDCDGPGPRSDYSLLSSPGSAEELDAGAEPAAAAAVAARAAGRSRLILRWFALGCGAVARLPWGGSRPVVACSHRRPLAGAPGSGRDEHHLGTRSASRRTHAAGAPRGPWIARARPERPLVDGVCVGHRQAARDGHHCRDRPARAVRAGPGSLQRCARPQEPVLELT